MCDTTLEKTLINYLIYYRNKNITWSYEEYKKNQIDKHFYKCENIFYSIIVYNYAKTK